MKLLFYFLLFVLQIYWLQAQPILQNISGKVKDKVTQAPLQGASIFTSGTPTTYYAVSDSNGNFELRNIPVGRIIVHCTYVGYQPFRSDNLLISSARQSEVEIELEELHTASHEVTVTTRLNPKVPVNRYTVVSGRSFSAEETQRFAASANDPSRMVLGFPGVQATRDTRSDIIIRGNNPVGMQWRLEGVDIPNPNHFARKGSSGGGITIFSLSMLDNSDFLTGAMPAEYGDALSGVFDMHLRKGNNQKAEHSLKAGMIGLDFATEGPIQQGKGSYLVNYRYSTLGLLQAIGLNLVGERESNTFQDLSFNLALSDPKLKSQWNVWGIGGISKETLEPVADPADWQQFDDYATYNFETRMGAVGVGHQLRLNEYSSIKSSLVLSGQQVIFQDDTLNKQKVATRVNDELYNNGRLTFASGYNHKFGAQANMKTGVYANMLFFDLHQTRFDYLYWAYRNTVSGKGHTFLLQPYLQMSIKPTTRITINPGVHIMYFTLNQKATIDPRLSFHYRIKNNQSLSLAYGLHSKILPIGSYFYRNNPAFPYPNKYLDMMRAHHLVAAYDNLLPKGWRIHAEAYYQRLFNIPVVNEINRTYWLLNEIEGYAKEALISKGKGTNIGLDVSVEKFFQQGFFIITSFSVFNSTYQPLDGKVYNTRFNSRTAGSVTGAKEWKLKKNRMLQLGWKMVYNGGLPLTPLANYPSTSREPVLDELRPFSERIPAYFRIDSRFAYRKDNPRYSWQIALDIQNLSGHRNIDGLNRRFDPSINQWIYRQQSGLVPVLSYQVDF